MKLSVAMSDARQVKTWAALDENTQRMRDEFRNAALEEAARACEAEYADPNWNGMYQSAAISCAAAIRARKRVV